MPVFSSPFRLRVALAILCVLASIAAPVSGQDDDLGFFESRSVLSDADDRFTAGDFATAEELYERVIAGVDADTKRHARALLGAGLAELSRAPGERDVDSAREHLRAYVAAPGAEESRIVNALLEVLGSPAPEEEPESAPPAPRRAAEPSGPTAADIASLQERIAELEAQLEQKNELIEELRQIVVEGDG